MAKLVVASPALMHLDISGMFMGGTAIKKIMIEGVAESKTLAAVHFADNQVSLFSRMVIFHILNRPKRKSEYGSIRNAITFVDKDND